MQTVTDFSATVVKHYNNDLTLIDISGWGETVCSSISELQETISAFEVGSKIRMLAECLWSDDSNILACHILQAKAFNPLPVGEVLDSLRESIGGVYDNLDVAEWCDDLRGK